MTSDDSEARRPGRSHRLSLPGTWQPGRASERRRRPEPLLKRRLPSGRGAIEQPNITSGGAGVLTPRFWVMVVLTGIAAGLLGALMMVILFNVQYAAFGYHAGSLQQGAEQASAARRVASLLIAGVFGGVAWFGLRRYTRGEPSEIDEAVWNGGGRLSFRRCLGTSVISEVVIGMGASIGREAAPKLLGGASGSVLAGWGALSAQQRRLLVACGGGAGLAAVYNVPLAGALFTPTLATGAVLGGAAGIAWNLAWPGSPSGAFAMVCAAAMIGASMQAPLSGPALVLELTHSGFGLMVPMMAATGIATLIAFHVDGYSIYSARLPARTADTAPAASAGSHAQQTSRSDPGLPLPTGPAAGHTRR